MTTLNTIQIEDLRQRLNGGCKIRDLAREAGISWQKLWGMLKTPSGDNGNATKPPAGAPSSQPSIIPNPDATSLSEKYRPRRLDQLWGQDEAVAILRRFCGHPCPRAFLFGGPTGTGKSSAALALAAEIGCDVAHEEMGGVFVISSGEQTADAVRSTMKRMWLTTLCGSGWKVLIINEADRMHLAAETIWLDALEHLPPRTIVIFTTNEPARLSRRMRDRCEEIAFEGRAEILGPCAQAFASAVWRAETGMAPDSHTITSILASATTDDTLIPELSFRRIMQKLARAIEARTC
jgi:replication-associated recombination protein RarA